MRPAWAGLLRRTNVADGPVPERGTRLGAADENPLPFLFIGSRLKPWKWRTITAVTDPSHRGLASQVPRNLYPRGPESGLLRRGSVDSMRKQKGFSLIELLIVIAIILVIAAIAIPNLMRARMAANDSSAAGSIHAINAAEIGYFGAYQNIGFTATLLPL